MKLARLAALPDAVLDKAAALIPVLSAAVKVFILQLWVFFSLFSFQFFFLSLSSITRRPQPQPEVTFDFKMEKLQYQLQLKLLDVGRRLSNLPDDVLMEELERVRRCYTDELSRILSNAVE